MSRTDVVSALALPDDDVLIASIFGVGSDIVPGAILESFLRSSLRHPKKLMVAEKCVADIITANRQMGSFLIFIISFLVVIGIVVQLDIPGIYLLHQTLRDPTVGDFQNACPPGVAVNSTVGCAFVKQSLPDIGVVEDVKLYLVNELVRSLWTGWDSGATAASPPFAGTWLVGGLLLRLAPQMHPPTAARLSASCAQLNMSVVFQISQVQQEFDCSALRHVLIPFSSTLDEALALAATFANFTLSIPDGEDVCAVAEFAAARAIDGAFVFGQVRIAIPRSGSVFTQIRVRPVEPNFHKSVLGLVILQIIFVVLSVLQQVHFYKVTRGWRKYVRPALIVDMLLMMLIIIAWRLLATASVAEEFAQTQFIPKNFDLAADQFDRGMISFGYWILLFMALSVRYLGAIEGVQIVVALISIASGEMVGLAVVFANFFFAFAIAAKNLFGFSQPEFSTAISSSSQLLIYFFGDSNFEMLASNHTAIGGVFFFVFKIFVTFVALNLLVAVVTAPLGDVRESADLHIKLFALIEIEVQHRSLTARLRWAVRKMLLPWANILAGSIPSIISPYSHHWQRVYLDIHTLYGSVDKFCVKDIVRSALNMLAMRERAVAAPRWKTNVIRETEHNVLVPDKVSYVILKLAILDESGSVMLRDARLTKVLIAYDVLSTEVEKVVEQQEARNEARRAEEKSLRDRLTKFRASNKSQALVQQKLESEIAASVSQFAHDKGKARKTRGAFSFALTEFVVKRISDARRLPLYMVFVLGFYAFFVGTNATVTQTSAFLCQNAHSGLRDGWYLTRCFDDQCRSAFTINKNWNDIEHLQDIYEYFSAFLEPRILNLSTPVANRTAARAGGAAGRVRNLTQYPVYFDGGTVREGGVFLRQHRGRRVPCGVKSAAAASGGTKSSPRDADIAALQCYTSGSDLDDQPRARPGDSVLPASAYQYQTACDYRGTAYRGLLRAVYPCGGYHAVAESVDDMQYIRGNWIDNATRFLQVSVRLNAGSDVILYHQYFELSDGGGKVFKEIFCEAVTDITLESRVLGGYLLVAVDLLVYAYLAIMARCETDPIQRVLAKPAAPMGAVMALFVSLIVEVAQANTANDNQDELKDRLHMVCITFYVSWTLMGYVTFPIIQIFSRQASTTFRVMALTFRACLIVLPYFAALGCAFLLGGYVVFGPRLAQFSTLKASALTIGRGLLGEWDHQPMFDERELTATLFTGLFVITIIIVLANLVLSLVTGAAEETRKESESLEFVEATGRLLGVSVVSGPLYESMLGWRVLDSWPRRKLREMFPKTFHGHKDGDGDDDVVSHHIAITERGRMSMFDECLLCFVGPVRAAELLHAIDYERLPEASRGSAIMCLCLLSEVFQRSNPGEDALDDERDLLISSSFKLPPIVGGLAKQPADAAPAPVEEGGGGGGGGSGGGSGGGGGDASWLRSDQYSSVGELPLDSGLSLVELHQRVLETAHVPDYEFL